MKPAVLMLVLASVLLGIMIGDKRLPRGPPSIGTLLEISRDVLSIRRAEAVQAAQRPSFRGLKAQVSIPRNGFFELIRHSQST